MGNRAVITRSRELDSKAIGVYLHWHGGRQWVEAFLKYCELQQYRTDDYGWANLCKVIGNFFEDGLSLGIDTLDHLDCDNYDNGVYIIKDWEIVDRKFFNGQEENHYPLYEQLEVINNCMPEAQRLPEEMLLMYKA